MNNPSPVRVRIAPSPTGNLHVGTARAALFNELFARHNNGTFILRIEDTDTARSEAQYEQSIIDGLTWLGLTWQEGPNIGGDRGPYRQSEKTERYTKALEQLLESGRAYRCTCAQKERGTGAIPVHFCACDTAGHTDGVIRLKVTPEKVTFTDHIRGNVSVHTDSFGGDFVIARSITDPLYHLAVVCDDADMAITHVIRGEDHLHNTIKHILIQRALGFTQPEYAHLPLLLDEQRKKLSKRSGETNLLAYKDAGFLPHTMVNYLALLGWNPGNDREYFTHEELAQEFSLERVQKGGAIFSLPKLQAFNRHYLSLLSDQELLAWATYHYDNNAIKIEDAGRLLRALKTELGRFSSYDINGTPLHEALSWHTPTWEASYEPKLLIWKKSNQKGTKEIVDDLHLILEELPEQSFTKEGLEEHVMKWIDKNNKSRGDVLWPMRVALTGREHSPGPFEVGSAIGKADSLRRLKNASDCLA